MVPDYEAILGQHSGAALEGLTPVTAFFALIPKDAYATRLAAEVAPYIKNVWLHPGEWTLTPVERLHLTVLYAGKVSENALPHLAELGNEIAPKFGELGFQNGRIEHVGTAIPNLIWLQFERNDVYDELVAALERGFPFPNWKNTPARILHADPHPMPHITLAQATASDPMDLRAGRVVIAEPLRTCCCDKLALITKRKGSARYEIVKEWTLFARGEKLKHHPACVPGYESSNIQLGIDISRMRYDKQLEVLLGIFMGTERQAETDKVSGKPRLASELFGANVKLELALKRILEAHALSTPHMAHEFALVPESSVVQTLQELFNLIPK